MKKAIGFVLTMVPFIGLLGLFVGLEGWRGLALFGVAIGLLFLVIGSQVLGQHLMDGDK